MPERYQILGKMARGGIGAIYRAHDTVMGREVAIKRLLPLEQTHLNEAADESLEREAAALAHFQHPNVVSIYAFEDDKEGSYVVMELVKGENLKETIERGALPLEDFEELTLQVLEPLIAARDLKLLHRDIKPSNIMLTWLATGKFQLKILDFGLAKFSQQPSTQTLDQTGSFLGSIDYLAPEQLELMPLDQRTDLYSLGCVLYYCLTQAPPFEGENAAKTMANHMKHQVTPIQEIRPDIPGPLADWLMRMISRYPSQRPLDAEAALNEFLAARSGISPIVSGLEDLPTAQIVTASATPAQSPPAEKPEASSSAPVKQPAAPKKVTKVHTRPQLITRPQAGSKRSRTTPTRHQTGARNLTGAQSRKKQKKSELKRSLLALGITALALIVAISILGKKKSEKSEPPLTKDSSVAGERPTKAASHSDGWAPAYQNPENPIRKTPKPAISQGLIAHYCAADQVLGSDLKKPARPGSRVSVWGNLAAGANPDHFLKTPTRENKSGLFLETADKKKHPELKSSIPVLKFGTQTLMVSHGDQIKGQFGTAGMTQIAVMRLSGGNGRFFRYRLPKNQTGLSFNANQRGYASEMNRGSIQQFAETVIGSHRVEWLIFSMTWNPKLEKQRHYIRLGHNDPIPGPAGDAPYKPLNVVSYSIGAIPDFGKTDSTGPSGQIAEILVYNRVLPDEELRKAEDQLFKRYFNPDFKRTLNIPIPNKDGTVPKAENPANYSPKTPPPPVNKGLVGHFNAGELTFGYDLKSPVKDGENVLAWGNLVKNGPKEHLMQLKQDQARATPILEKASQKDNSGLNRNHPVLHFPWNTTLKTIGWQVKDQLNESGVTGFLVLKPAGKENTIFRMEIGDNHRLLTLSRNGNSFKSTMQVSKSKWTSTQQNITANRFTILSFIWDHEKGEQTLFARQHDGQTVQSETKPGAVGTRDIDRYWLGLYLGKYDKKQPGFSGKVAELILYARPLALDERKSVEDYLHERYFKK